jgi:hypothetical protein
MKRKVRKVLIQKGRGKINNHFFKKQISYRTIKLATILQKQVEVRKKRDSYCGYSTVVKKTKIKNE